MTDGPGRSCSSVIVSGVAIKSNEKTSLVTSAAFMKIVNVLALLLFPQSVVPFSFLKGDSLASEPSHADAPSSSKGKRTGAVKRKKDSSKSKTGSKGGQESIPMDDFFTNTSGCDPDWQSNEQLWTARHQQWQDASALNNHCYNMTLYRSCFCPPEWRGPWQVAIRDDVVVDVKPFNENNSAFVYDLVKTMNQLFDTVYSECFENCPNSGADFCNIQYANQTDASYIISMYIDISKMIADEEIGYSVSNFTFCA